MSTEYLTIDTEVNLGLVALSTHVFDTITLEALKEIPEIIFEQGFINHSKAIHSYFNQNNLEIEITLGVKFGYRLYQVVEKVQSKISQAILAGTGIQAAVINVHVNRLEF